MNPAVPPAVDLPEVIGMLCKESQMIHWDDAWDMMSGVGPQHRSDVPLLTTTIANDELPFEARRFAFDALRRIAPDSGEVFSAAVALARSHDPLLKSQGVRALSICGRLDPTRAAPALASVCRDSNNYVGAIASAFLALTKLVGLREAISCVKPVSGKSVE